jgi:hypothetical protein
MMSKGCVDDRIVVLFIPLCIFRLVIVSLQDFLVQRNLSVDVFFCELRIL